MPQMPFRVFGITLTGAPTLQLPVLEIFFLASVKVDAPVLAQ
jgi:hypothetical protein